MRDSTFKSAVAELEDALKRSLDDLAEAIARIIPDADTDDILSEEADGSISVDGAELRALLNELADAPEEIDRALADCAWEVARALREFKRASARETAQLEEGR